MVVRDLCRGEETRVYILTQFLEVNKLCGGGCPVCCPRVVVSGLFVLGCPVAFEPSGFVVVVSVVEHLRVIYRRGHVTSLVRTGGIVRVGGR
jgi:hypothetical protein